MEDQAWSDTGILLDSIRYIPIIGKRANTPWNALNTGRKDSEKSGGVGITCVRYTPNTLMAANPQKILTPNDLNTLEPS